MLKNYIFSLNTLVILNKIPTYLEYLLCCYAKFVPHIYSYT